MNRSRRTRHNRAGAALIVLALVGAACGSTDEQEQAAAADSIVSVSSAEAPIPPADMAALEAWAGVINTGWQDLSTNRQDLFFAHNTAIQTDDTIAPWLEFLRGTADLYDGFAVRLDQVPAHADVEPAAGAFATEVRSAGTSLRAHADDLDEGGALPVDDANRTFDVLGEVDQTVSLACFDLQDAVASADLPLIDCAGSSEEPAAPVPQDDGPPILAVGGYDRVEAGTYRIEVFVRPISIELPEPMRMVVYPHDIELAPVADEGQLAFWILAPDDLPVPGTPYGAIGETVPFPDDLGTWLSEIPVEISESGTTQVGEMSVPFWTIPLPEDASEVGVDQWVFADFNDSPQLFPLREGGTVWQIPHPEGPLVVLALAKFEIPDAPDLAEMTAYAESIISTIEVFEGTGAPSDAPAPDDTDSGDDDVPGDDAALDEIRAAVMGMEGSEAGIMSPLPDLIGVSCSDPAFETEDFDLEPTWIGYGTEDGFAAVYEFADPGDRDEWFAAAEDVQPTCRATGPFLIESELVDSEPGMHFTIAETTDFEGEISSSAAHTRKIGATGLLSLNSATNDGINALLAKLGLA